jgi:hypothetical protein
MTDKEVQAAETEVLDLIKRLRDAPQNTATHETLARIEGKRAVLPLCSAAT